MILYLWQAADQQHPGQSHIPDIERQAAAMNRVRLLRHRVLLIPIDAGLFGLDALAQRGVSGSQNNTRLASNP